MKKIVFYVHGFLTPELIDGVRMKDAFAIFFYRGAHDIDCI